MVFISWETHRRTRTLCQRLGLDLAEILEGGARIRRYLFSIARTLRLLSRRKPSVVIFQNPSIVLATLMVLARRVWGFKIVMDAHNSAIRPLEGRYRILNAWAELLIRHCDLTLVTNEPLASQVRAMGGRALVLPDALPDVPEYCRPKASSNSAGRATRAMLVCTWAADEPYEEVVEAFLDHLGPPVRLAITGRYPARYEYLKEKGVQLTGFLPDAEYWQLLQDSDFVIDLTYRDDCLVCGAYEAIACGKPLILSDTPVNRALFGDIALYVDNSAQGIADAVTRLVEDYPLYRARVERFRESYEDRWRDRLEALKQQLGTEQKAG